MNKVGSLPSGRVMLSRTLKRYFEPLRLPMPPVAISLPYTLRLILLPYHDIGPPALDRLSSAACPALAGLPREKTPAASVPSARVHRPSPADKRVGFSNSSYEATCRFTCVAACLFAVWELTTPDRSDAAPACYPIVRTTPGTGL